MARCSIITKIFFSVVSVAVADTNYPFVYTDNGNSGKDCDSIIFKQSTLWTKIQIYWNYTVRDVFQEKKVQMYHTSLQKRGFALNRKIPKTFGGSNLSAKEKGCTTITCAEHGGM